MKEDKGADAIKAVSFSLSQTALQIPVFTI